MSLVEELQKEAETAFYKWIDQFVEGLLSELKESAKEGYKGYIVKINGRDDRRFFSNKSLLDELEKRLEGCKVHISNERKKMPLTNYEYTEKNLHIKW
ncbi:hypothetical protein [Oceanobacillus massiliensis]|uniref:hypothetical protein n=1 Tax=Oceanobacillus massiliensis TaxID=1465765 RepID=UPI000289E95F|nr:hypothetical protein [Oceanobacillus massiliensis]